MQSVAKLYAVNGDALDSSWCKPNLIKVAAKTSPNAVLYT
jgi:hypothetical protein